MSVSQALNHWFITTGCASTTATTTEVKPKINPETVHMSPSPVPADLFSPNTASQCKAASTTGGEDWKRRQFN